MSHLGVRAILRLVTSLLRARGPQRWRKNLRTTLSFSEAKACTKSTPSSTNAAPTLSMPEQSVPKIKRCASFGKDVLELAACAGDAGGARRRCFGTAVEPLRSAFLLL